MDDRKKDAVYRQFCDACSRGDRSAAERVMIRAFTEEDYEDDEGPAAASANTGVVDMQERVYPVMDADEEEDYSVGEYEDEDDGGDGDGGDSEGYGREGDGGDYEGGGREGYGSDGNGDSYDRDGDGRDSGDGGDGDGGDYERDDDEVEGPGNSSSPPTFAEAMAVDSLSNR